MRANRSVTAAPQRSRIVGCAGCAGHQRPGYVRVWGADPTSPNGARWSWHDCPEGCTADSRTASVARQLAVLGIGPALVAAPAPEVREDQAPVDVRQLPHADVPAGSTAGSTRTARSTGSTRPASRTRSTTEERPGLVAAVCLDAGRGGTVTADADGIGVPGAVTVEALFAWIASGPALGIAPVHTDGRRHNGTVVLTAKLCKALGLPKTLPTDAKGARALAKTLRAAADAAGVDIGERIAGRMAAVPRKAPGVRRAYGVTLVIAPWLGQADGPGQAAEHHLLELGENDAAALARRLRLMADDLGVPLISTPAVTARALLDAVRPRERWSEERNGTRVPRDGALPSGDVSVPVAAGRCHPLTQAAADDGRPVCREDDLIRWTRPLTDGEAAAAWAVEVDVSTAHLAVTGSLPLPVGALQHTDAPRFDKRTAGIWWCDFTGTRLVAAHVPETLRARAADVLPHPATTDGTAPTAPGWYATPTVAYMVEAYGFDPATIGEAYVSTHTAALLKEWTARLREAYKGRLSVLGITDGMAPDAFLAAYAVRGERAAADPDAADAAALVDLYKGIYRGATGMWAQGVTPRPGESQEAATQRWLKDTAASWHYRPEIRLHIVAASRTGTHRRIVKTYALTGRAPAAVHVDGLLYACEAPDPLPLVPLTADGAQVPGALRLGSAPGSCKHDATLPMATVREALASGEPLQGAYGVAAHHGTDGRPNDTEED
ncbi:hypothetical protein [Streptomyces sp. NBC_00280]|uniref:hypothetical protein n=1 Tax=Streptomyces sp. NBC_00280 TaxID=2975699 RepID=UPI00324671EF